MQMRGTKNIKMKLLSTGVIDILGGGGGLVEYKAALLASRGFATLALAYMDYDDLPKFPTIDLDYFEEAANWLSYHSNVLPNGIGVHAICYGSLSAILMACFKFETIKAVVAISPVITTCFVPFTYKSKISEVIPFDRSKKIITEEGGVYRYSRPTITDYSVPVSKYPAVAPVENISCPVLLVYGTGDLNGNPEFSVSHIRDSLKKQGKENLCSVLCYPNAGHLIEPPYTPHSYASYMSNIITWTGDYHIVWGGEMNPHARAQEDAWPKILRFLRENLQNVK